VSVGKKKKVRVKETGHVGRNAHEGYRKRTRKGGSEGQGELGKGTSAVWCRMKGDPYPGGIEISLGLVGGGGKNEKPTGAR